MLLLELGLFPAATGRLSCVDCFSVLDMCSSKRTKHSIKSWSLVKMGSSSAFSEKRTAWFFAGILTCELPTWAIKYQSVHVLKHWNVSRCSASASVVFSSSKDGYFSGAGFMPCFRLLFLPTAAADAFEFDLSFFLLSDSFCLLGPFLMMSCVFKFFGVVLVAELVIGEEEIF